MDIFAYKKQLEEKLAAVIKVISDMGGSARAAITAASGKGRKRKPMSAEGRAKIAAAQKARWAKHKKTVKK